MSSSHSTTLSNKVRNGRLSRNPNTAVNLPQDQPNCFGDPECNLVGNGQEYPPTKKPMCIPVRDFQSLIKSLYKQWLQDNHQIQAVANNGDNAYDPLYIKSVTQWDEITANAYAVATNRMIPDPSQFTNHVNEPVVFDDTTIDWQTVSTEIVPVTEEDRKENEIDQVTEPRWDSNVVTAKPITSFISLPRGTNDYMY